MVYLHFREICVSLACVMDDGKLPTTPQTPGPRASVDPTAGHNSPGLTPTAGASATSNSANLSPGKNGSRVGGGSNAENTRGLMLEGNTSILGGEEASRWAPGTNNAGGAQRFSLHFLKARGAATR